MLHCKNRKVPEEAEIDLVSMLSLVDSTREYTEHTHSVKSVRIRSYSGSYFPAFGLNTERYSVSKFGVTTKKSSLVNTLYNSAKYTAQKMKIFVKDFFSKCEQIRSFL